MLDRRGRLRSIDPRWCRDDAMLLGRDDWPDEAIAAAGHGFDPAVAAGLSPQNAAQGRDLHREIALLDCLAGPHGLDQRIL
jgi:hypothetical protein